MVFGGKQPLPNADGNHSAYQISSKSASPYGPIFSIKVFFYQSKVIDLIICADVRRCPECLRKTSNLKDQVFGGFKMYKSNTSIVLRKLFTYFWPETIFSSDFDLKISQDLPCISQTLEI